MGHYPFSVSWDVPLASCWWNVAFKGVFKTDVRANPVDSSQLTPLEVKKWCYTKLLPDGHALHPFAKEMPEHQVKEANFNLLYPRSQSFGQNPDFMTIAGRHRATHKWRASPVGLDPSLPQLNCSTSTLGQQMHNPCVDLPHDPPVT